MTAPTMAVLTFAALPQVRCELAVIAQHRHRVRQHIKSRPLVQAMLHLESRLVECEMQSRGGVGELPPGARLFLCIEDFPKLNGSAESKRGVHQAATGVRLRRGDFVQGDSSKWLAAMESDHQILVPVACNGRRGAVPPHLLRWLRQPGKKVTNEVLGRGAMDCRRAARAGASSTVFWGESAAASL